MNPNPDRFNRMMELFAQAVELPENERPGFLAAQCGDDSALCDEILTLLRHDTPATGTQGGDPGASPEGSPGGWLAELNEYFAERGYTNLKQLDATKHSIVLEAIRSGGSRVAIKILPEARYLGYWRLKFEEEVRILGKVAHPHIAHLYGSGEVTNGTPWLAMEYVEGTHLDKYCQSRGASLAERLRLFQDVCGAVLHAHRLGVIHRDLKPQNILVTSEGVVKLLDFGIARELDSKNLAEHTSSILTPPYAAPEQIENKPTGVFTDAYTLGAILWELLTDKPLVDRRLPYPDMFRLITEVDPGKPSAEAKAKSHFRDASASQWRDLDSLCLKALRKEVGGKHGRYESVEELLGDLDRYLGLKPLKAGPDTPLYKASKFVRRNRNPIAIAAGLAFVVAILTVVYAIRLHNADLARRAEQARTERVSKFMTGLFQGDASAGPQLDLKVITLLDRGVRDAQALNSDPAVLGDLYESLGLAYYHLGSFDRGEQILRESLHERRKAFRPDNWLVAKSLEYLALLLWERGSAAEAPRRAAEGVEIDRRQLQPNDPNLGYALAVYGYIVDEQGKHREAQPILEESYRILSLPGAPEVDLAEAISYLANNAFYRRDFARSESLNRQALALDEKLHGKIHPNVANDLINLGNIAVDQNDYPGAEGFFRQGCDTYHDYYGRDHPATLDCQSYLSQALLYQKKYDAAERTLGDAVERMNRIYGGKGTNLAAAFNQLGSLETTMRRYDAAESDLKRAIEIRSAMNPGHEDIAVFTANLGDVYYGRQEFARAEDKEREAIRLFAASEQPNHPLMGTAHMKLGRVLSRERKFPEAKQELIFGLSRSPNKNDRSASCIELAAVYKALNEPDQSAQYCAGPAK